MQTIIFLVLAAFLGCAFTASAQVRTEETRMTVDSLKGDTTYTKSVTISASEDITPRNSMIVINPLKFFLFYNITYIHKFSASTAGGFGLQVPTLSGIDGFGVYAELRLHPSGKTLRGFYAAPNISYNHLSIDNTDTSPFSVGVLVGWQWFPGDEFAMGLGLGIDYYTGLSDQDSRYDRYDGTAPLVRFDIGYAW